MMRWRSPSSRRVALWRFSRRPHGAALGRQQRWHTSGNTHEDRRPQHTLLFCRPHLRLGSSSWVPLSSSAILALPRSPSLSLPHTHTRTATHPHTLLIPRTPHVHTPHTNTHHTQTTHLVTPHRTPRGSRWTASGASFSSLRSTPRGWSGALANAPPPPSWRPSLRSWAGAPPPPAPSSTAGCEGSCILSMTTWCAVGEGRGEEMGGRAEGRGGRSSHHSLCMCNRCLSDDSVCVALYVCVLW